MQKDFLQRAADVMRRELFAPLGVVVPQAPVIPASPFYAFKSDGWEGMTSIERSTNKVDSINVVDWSRLPITGPDGFKRDRLWMAGILAHEMAHAALAAADVGEDGHSGPFPALIHKLGLLDDPKYGASNSRPGPQFVEFYNKHLAALA